MNEESERAIVGFLKSLALRCKDCFSGNTHRCRTCDAETAKALLHMVSKPKLTGPAFAQGQRDVAERRRQSIVNQLEKAQAPMRASDFRCSDKPTMETLEMMLYKMTCGNIIKRRKSGLVHYYALSETLLDTLP